ncbi:MAG: GNAT family N-acetyltransferase [Herpetosiphonaceae bacterium]|nr:GNAT family N-acetyltransferase [Herpetosiphonaceae bacterium]
MSTTYRLMQSNEEVAVLTLWSEVFNVPYHYEQARFRSDPLAHTRTYVAVAEDGTVLSTLHYLVSLRRDVDGTPRRVGEVDPVATRAEARRQGHAGRLIELALDALRHDGCAWSLLLASGEGRPLYERYGWRSFPERWRQGTILGSPPPGTHAYTICPYDPRVEPDGWERLGVVAHAYNATRPLTVARDADYWQRYAAIRVSHWITAEGLVILVAHQSSSDHALRGYAMANFYDVGFVVRELAMLPDDSAVVPELLTRVVQEAVQRNSPLAGLVNLSYEPQIGQALAALFGETLHTRAETGQLLARTIHPDFTDVQLNAIFADPRALYSSIDHF